MHWSLDAGHLQVTLVITLDRLGQDYTKIEYKSIKVDIGPVAENKNHDTELTWPVAENKNHDTELPKFRSVFFCTV